MSQQTFIRWLHRLIDLVLLSTMTITEVALLKITAPHTWSSPSIIRFFLDLSAKQSACSGYPLLFLRRIHVDQSSASTPHADHTALAEETLLVSGWQSLAAHLEWIEGGINQELLRQASEEQLLTVGLFMHLDIHFPELEGILLGEEESKVIFERVEEQIGQEEKAGDVRWEKIGRTVDDGKQEVWRFAGYNQALKAPLANVAAPTRLLLKITSIPKV